jgi:hypothetical protein
LITEEAKSEGKQMGIQETAVNATMTIRRMDLAEADIEAVRRLAELDSRQPLEGPVLGAEVEGVLLAAIAVNTSEVVADPFSRTAEVRALLELRTAQLSGRRPRRRGGLRADRRPRPAVGGSPPGQIISLPRVN